MSAVSVTAIPAVSSQEFHIFAGGGWMKNLLYYGDNLDVLRRHVGDETVDLVYLDPPFNSNQNYNVLFAEHDGTKAAAQIKAFGDTWTWDESAARAYQEVVEAGGRVSEVLQAFRAYLDRTDMLAYLSMMAPRLVELRRVMKPTGSIYLHCDPTASHYLKILMDALFGPERFMSEIIWKRYGAHNDSKGYGAVHDTLLFYAKTGSCTFNKQHQPYEDAYIAERFRFSDPDGRKWSEQNLASPNPRPNLTYPYTASNGVTYHPPPNGWKYTHERMTELDRQGRLHFPAKQGGRLRLKNYLDELPGVPIQDVWTDLTSIGGTSPERLGYPTQKPLSLLERIVLTSSNEEDVILDPFCGCGTAIAAAQRLNRRWIGIDITHLAIGLIKSRLRDAFGDEIAKTYTVKGEPTTVEDAAELASEDHYQFQWWALGLVGARRAEEKKGADKGIDGRLYFHDEGLSGRTKQVILSVKSGKLKATDVRDVRAVIEREKAEIGVLLSMETPTRPMRAEAASAGFYKSSWGEHPRIQLLTVAELLEGKGIDYPAPRQTNITIKRAERAQVKDAENGSLF
jgi:site-specific DNA-methyltransferase (adenine-specific)